MKKILYVSLGENMFGTEKFIYYLIKNLPKDKFQVHWGIPYKSKLSEMLGNYGIEYFNFENDTLNGFRIKGLKNIAKYIYKNKINIVHSNSGILPCIAAKFMGVEKCFETRHGIFYSDEQLNNFSTLQKYHEKVKQYFVNYQIAIAENDKNRMIKYFGMKAEKIKVVNYGIDIDDVRKSGVKPSIAEYRINRTFKFVNIGRFTYQKSQEDLLKAVILLKDEYTNFKLTVIGEGEEKDKLNNFVSDNNLGDYVKIESYKKNIHEELLKHDVLVMTSRFEGVPYVVSDSMALGIPVIHTDVGGVSNVIRNGVDGLIVRVGNIKEIKDAMKRIALDGELYKRIQESAFKKIEEYSIRRMVDEYVKLYLM